MRRSAQRTLTALVVLIAMILSQLWITAYACERIGALGADVTAVSATRHERAQAYEVAAMPQHADLSSVGKGALCASHCDDSTRPAHTVHATPADVMWLPVVWGQPSVNLGSVIRAIHVRETPHLLSAPPPSRILFQVFRT